MRDLVTFESKSSALMSAFATGIAETIAVRRAERTAQKARAEAEASIRARAEFLANMNHELRTPLNAIIGFATMLKEGESYKLSAEQRDTYADYVLQSADLLLSHINTLLEAAALDGGEVAIEPASINLAETLGEAVKRAKVAADAAKVSIEDKTGAAGAPAGGWGDPVRTAQALDHVIRTAIKSSPEKARIIVRAVAADDGWGEIAIRDHGPGLSGEDIAKALSAFDETHRGLDRSFAGPGIGLAIARTFIEMQGGRFAVKSKLGEGTLIRFALPPPEETGAAASGETEPDKEIKLAG